MKTHNVEQGGLAWLKLRAQYPTASEFGQLVTPKTLKPSAQMHAYIARKIAEKWMGKPVETYSGGAMEQGSVLEEEARPWYALETGATIETPGFITHDDDTAGCSPDALARQGEQAWGVEIKCPEPQTHVAYLLAGVLPDQYRLQVQGSMLVTEMERWDFLSYCRGFPALLVTVERDKEVCTALVDALAEFQVGFQVGWKQLVEANGGYEPEPQAEKEERIPW